MGCPPKISSTLYITPTGTLATICFPRDIGINMRNFVNILAKFQFEFLFTTHRHGRSFNADVNYVCQPECMLFVTTTHVRPLSRKLQ